MEAGASEFHQVFVLPGATYDVVLYATNDGDSDRIAVVADGKTIGVYATAENRAGGNGWYQAQYSPAYQFTATGHTAIVGVKVEGSGNDGYGTWPQELLLMIRD